MKTLLKKSPGFAVLSLLVPCLLLGLQSGCTSHPPTTSALQRLQGTWEGDDVGQNYSRKVAIRITGNSLHFQAPTNNEWADGTFTLSAGTNPQQLRFTMKGCVNPDHVGQVIVAIFKIEDGTLTLAASQDNTAPPPETFPSTLSGPLFRCDLKKVQPQKRIAK